MANISVKPEDRCDYKVTQVEFRAEDAANNKNAAIVITLRSKIDRSDSHNYVIFKNQYPNAFEDYLALIKPLNKTIATAKEIKAFDRTNDDILDDDDVDDLLLWTNCGWANIIFDTPMNRVWNQDMEKVTVAPGITKSVRKGDIIIDPSTGKPKAYIGTAIFLRYLTPTGDALSRYTDAMKEYDRAISTFRPIVALTTPSGIAHDDNQDNATPTPSANTDPFAGM